MLACYYSQGKQRFIDGLTETDSYKIRGGSRQAKEKVCHEGEGEKGDHELG